MSVISYDDLESALVWVSSPPALDNSAYVSKATGEIFHGSESMEAEDALPPDCDDSDLYWSVPHKNDLGLGRDLVLAFVRQHLPAQMREVQDAFRHRGAYAWFKHLLQQAGLLEVWFAFEQEATQRALLEWAHDSGLPVVPDCPPKPGVSRPDASSAARVGRKTG